MGAQSALMRRALSRLEASPKPSRRKLTSVAPGCSTRDGTTGPTTFIAAWHIRAARGQRRAITVAADDSAGDVEGNNLGVSMARAISWLKAFQNKVAGAGGG